MPHLDTAVTLLARDPVRLLIECPTCAALVSSGYLLARYSTMNPIGLSGFSMSNLSTIWMKRLQRTQDEGGNKGVLGLILYAFSSEALWPHGPIQLGFDDDTHLAEHAYADEHGASSKTRHNVTRLLMFLELRYSFNSACTSAVVGSVMCVCPLRKGDLGAWLNY